MGNSTSKSKLRSRLAACEAHSAALTKQLVAHDAESEKVVGTTEQIRAETSQLKEQLLVQQEVAKAQQQEAEKQIVNLRREVELRDVNHGKTLAEVGHSQERQQQYEEQIRAATEQKRQYEEKLAALQLEAETTKAAQEEAKARCSTSQKGDRDQIADLQTKIYRNSEDMLSMQGEVSVLKKQRDKSAQECEMLTVVLQDERDNVKNVQRKNDACADLLRQETAKLQSMTTERDRVQIEADQTAAAARRLEEAIAKLEARSTAATQASASRPTPPASPSSTSTSLTRAHDFAQPYTFSSSSIGKHEGCTQRVSYTEWQGEMRVDVREWFGFKRTTRGVQLPVADAQRLSEILPEVVRQAEAERARRELY